MYHGKSRFGLVSLAFCALFTAGCIAETSDPAGLICHDDERGACVTKDNDGDVGEVPCDDALRNLEPEVDNRTVLLCPGCCDPKIHPKCPTKLTGKVG